LTTIRPFHHPIFGEIRFAQRVLPGGQMFLAAKIATLPDLDQSTCRFRASNMAGKSPNEMEGKTDYEWG
jgi:hypothetical protein